ncbi:hypothetical protein N0V90_008383 [Kalmusia sp. IMI 367209]|nr:hypothetical protein N0V90_008383 [Kalmusia sp. IMI 367209]
MDFVSRRDLLRQILALIRVPEPLHQYGIASNVGPHQIDPSLGIDDNGVPVFGCNQTNVDSYCCFDDCKCNAQFETFRFDDSDVYTITIIGENFSQTRTSSLTPSSAPSISTSKSKSATVASVSASLTHPEPSNTAHPEKEGKDSSSNPVAIGVGVGVGVGAILFIGAAVAFLFWRRNKKQREHNVAEDTYYHLRDTKPLGEGIKEATRYAHYAETDHQ